MTYQELLTATAKRKELALQELDGSLQGPGGFLVRAEIERNPGMVAWLWLAKDFCEALAEHMSELLEQADDSEARELYDIYTAYEDNDDRLYELLPDEAKLFA